MSRGPVIRRAVAVAALAVALGGAIPLAAQNLLANPDFQFSAGLSGWTVFDGFFPPPVTCTTAQTCASFSVVPVDCCAGSPENGVSAPATVSTAWRDLFQCVPVTAGTAYEFSVRSRRTDDLLHQNGRPYLVVRWFSSIDCSGAEAGPSTYLTTDAVPWTRLESVAAAPAGALSADYRLGVTSVGLNGNMAIIDFAAPAFGVNGTVPPPARIPTLDGWGLAALVALLGFGGWKAVARRRTAS